MEPYRIVFIPHIGTWWLDDEDKLKPIYLNADEFEELKELADVDDFSCVQVMTQETWMEVQHHAMSYLMLNGDNSRNYTDEDILDRARNYGGE